LKNTRNDIFQNFKNSKTTQRILKNKKIKEFKKSYKEASTEENIEKTDYN